LKDFVVVEAAAHLNLQFGYGHDAGIGFRRGRRPKVNPAVSLDHALVVAAGAVFRRPPVQGFAHSLGFGEILAGPRVAVPDTGVSRQGWQEKQQHCHSETQTLASM